MEKREEISQKAYRKFDNRMAKKLIKEEEKHEQKLLGLLEDSRIRYAGSIVLGLNDALVELTGALAGLTFALREGNLIALTGFITGFAASLSMAASEYLSSKEEAEKMGTKTH